MRIIVNSLNDDFIDLYIKYLHANDSATLDIIGRELVKYRNKIPKVFKEIKRPLYRGIELSNKAFEDIVNGKSIILRDRPITSWTLDKNMAKGFAYTPSGVILRLPAKQANVLFHAANRTARKLIHMYCAKNKIYLENEPCDVLIIGSGLSQISIKDIAWFREVKYRNIL